MYVVVIGLGQVGRHLVEVLETEGHDIVAIDQEERAVRKIEESHDVMTLCGYGASEEILDKANAERSDLVVAVTNHDEVNLIAALAARQAGAKRAIARVEGNVWARSPQGVRHNLFGVDVAINPSVIVAQELAKIARSHGAVEVIDLAQEQLELVQVELTEKSKLLHRPISSLPLPKDTLIAAIVRNDELFIPGGADNVLAKDRAYLIGRPSDLTQAEDLFTSRREAKRVFIVGGGVTGEMMARLLVEGGDAKVTIADSSPERAKELSATLDRVSVVAGSGTDTRFLEEEEVGTYDLVAAVTADDEVNLMAALLAKKKFGVSRTAALVQEPGYAQIYRDLGIDVVVSPRSVAADHILRYCRPEELKSLTVLQNGQAEVLELLARRGSRSVGVPLRRLKLPRGALVGAIVRDDGVIVPRGDDEIREGDSVVILATSGARATVERLFRPGLL